MLFKIAALKLPCSLLFQKVFSRYNTGEDDLAMKTIVVASTNPVKAQAAIEGFSAMFPAEEFTVEPLQAVPSISVQPMSDVETLAGALERARMVRDAAPAADYWVGIEGGAEPRDGQLGVFAWVVVLDRERQGQGRSGEFFLPEKVAGLVRSGVELGEADDRVFGRSNSKQQNGAVGLLTADVVDRAGLYVPAVIFALIPFKNPQLYPLQGI
jgi:inosine/xanthosine triphosphatase